MTHGRNFLREWSEKRGKFPLKVVRKWSEFWKNQSESSCRDLANGFFLFNLFTCYFISIDETPRVGSSVVVVGHLGSSGDGSSNIITCGYTNSAPRWSCLNSGSEDSSLLRTSQILDLALYAGKTCKKYVYLKVVAFCLSFC